MAVAVANVDGIERAHASEFRVAGILPAESGQRAAEYVALFYHARRVDGYTWHS